MRTTTLAWAALIGSLLFACKKDDKVTATLTVDKSSIQATAATGETSLQVTANINWKLSGLPEWMTATPSTGKGNANIKIVYTANTALTDRMATVTLAGAGLSKTIEFKQAGAVSNLSITQVTPSAKGGAPITITGTGFSATLTTNKVKVNGKEATVTAGTTTALTVTVPMGAGDGMVEVMVGENKATGGPFTYEWVWYSAAIAGNGSTSTFASPSGLAIGPDNVIYVVDRDNHRIRKINFLDGGTSSITTIAGSDEGKFGTADGQGTAARFSAPKDLSFDPAGNLYVTDAIGSIRKITPDGQVSTLKDNEGKNINIANWGIEALNGGNLYLSSDRDKLIYHVSETGVVKTIVATGDNNIMMNAMFGITSNTDGTALYFTDANFHRVLEAHKNGNAFTPTIMAGSASGLAGKADGSGAAATFDNPYAIARDAQGKLYVADMGNGIIRQITPQPGGGTRVTTIIGAHTVPNTTISDVGAVAVSQDGRTLYIAEWIGNRVHKLILQ